MNITLPTPQQITDAFRAAPGYIKDFLDGDELDDAFSDIRTTHKLHLDHAGVLADLLNAVILELIPLGQFGAALAEHLPGLGQDVRTAITREANEKLFAVLRGRAEAPAPEPVLPASVESPPAPATSVPSVFVQKLAGAVSEPQKTVTVPMPSPSVETKPIEEPRYADGTDPYREPVE